MPLRKQSELDGSLTGGLCLGCRAFGKESHLMMASCGHEAMKPFEVRGSQSYLCRNARVVVRPAPGCGIKMGVAASSDRCLHARPCVRKFRKFAV